MRVGWLLAVLGVAACGAAPAEPRSTAAAAVSAGAPFRPFSASSPWNQPIETNPRLASDSSALVADLATSSRWPWLTINIEQYSIPVYWADAATPRVKVAVTSVAGFGFHDGDAQVPIPPNAEPAVGTDKHLCVIDRAANRAWDFWEASKSDRGWTCSVCAAADLSQSGVRPPTAHEPWWMGHGARACGFPLIAGLITVDEMRAGIIEHALVIAYPHIRSRYYTPPASTAQGSTDEAIATRGIPCGGRVQLDPSLDLERLHLSRSGKIVARALQRYGAFVGDYSGAVSLYADASAGARAIWRSGLLDTYEVKDALPLKLLRVLEVGPLFDNRN